MIYLFLEQLEQAEMNRLMSRKLYNFNLNDDYEKL